MSKGALCATSTAPARNSRKRGQHLLDRRRGRTIAWVIPVSTVMNGGIGPPGLTRVANSPSSSPPRTLTAPISVMPAAVGRAAGGLQVHHHERGRSRRPDVAAGRRSRPAGRMLDVRPHVPRTAG